VEARRHRYVVEDWGEGELWTAGRVVLEHSFRPVAVGSGAVVAGRVQAGRPEGTPTSPSGSLADAGAGVGADFAPEVERRLRRVLAGDDEDLADVELDLAWCTPFQRAAIETLRAVPRGEVVTYGELAALAGYPGAARAAGSVCAANRFWLLVPCHRVVSASGIGGYGSSGTELKARLLELEGVPVGAL
jgi:methylated-DNA-[protein]-cysteine S-methyltransferase